MANLASQAKSAGHSEQGGDQDGHLGPRSTVRVTIPEAVPCSNVTCGKKMPASIRSTATSTDGTAMATRTQSTQSVPLLTSAAGCPAYPPETQSLGGG